VPPAPTPSTNVSVSSTRVEEPAQTSEVDTQVVNRKPTHPLFAAKARGLRLKVMRFTPSWFSVTMVSSHLRSQIQSNALYII
jgi:hypothetical protein